RFRRGSSLFGSCESLRRTDHPAGNLAAIGDEERFQHVRHSCSAVSQTACARMFPIFAVTNADSLLCDALNIMRRRPTDALACRTAQIFKAEKASCCRQPL